MDRVPAFGDRLGGVSKSAMFRIGVAALGSGIETGHFFGSGDATIFKGSQDIYEIAQDRPWSGR